jgi:hypothetical protein
MQQQAQTVNQSDVVPHFERAAITANFFENGKEISGTTLDGKFY